MQALAFAVVFVLCAAATASVDYSIQVKIFAPFYIEFDFDVSPTFEPVSLKAYASTSAMDMIVFQLYAYTNRITFRNVQKLTLNDNCIINAELEYIESLDFNPRSLDNGYNRENDIKRVTFDYKVSDKPDKIYITLPNRPGEGDSVNPTTTENPAIQPPEPTYESEDTGGDIDLDNTPTRPEQPHGKPPTDGNPPEDYTQLIEEIFDNEKEYKPDTDINTTTDTKNPIEQPNSAGNQPDDGDNAEHMQEYDGDEECEVDESSTYQQKLLETAFAHGSFGKRLLLTGDFPPFLANPVETVREIIVNTLELPELEWNILQAKFLKQGILFEMALPKDAIEVLTNAPLYLKNMKIESTERDFFDVLGIGGRMSDESMGR